MNNFGEKVAIVFPGKWTGGSTIHRSVALGIMTLEDTTPKKIIAKVLHFKLGVRLWDFLHKRFPALEWMVSEEEFTALMLKDIYSHLTTGKSTQTTKMIKNPDTGNIFHIMANYGDIIGGIRYWCNRGTICFRFRLAQQFEVDVKTRTNIRQTVEEAVAEVKEIMIVLDLNEPNHVYATEEESQKEINFQLV